MILHNSDYSESRKKVRPATAIPKGQKDRNKDLGRSVRRRPFIKRKSRAERTKKRQRSSKRNNAEGPERPHRRATPEHDRSVGKRSKGCKENVDAIRQKTKRRKKGGKAILGKHSDRTSGKRLPNNGPDHTVMRGCGSENGSVRENDQGARTTWSIFPPERMQPRTWPHSWIHIMPNQQNGASTSVRAMDANMCEAVFGIFQSGRGNHC